MLDSYEEDALLEVKAWHATKGSRGWGPAKAVSQFVGKGVETAVNLPVLREALKPLEHVYQAGFKGLAHTIPLDKVVAEFEHHGISALHEIRGISLRHPDEATRNFGAQYASIAAAQGGLVGAAALIPGVGNAVALGLVGADTAAVTALGMRMVCDYAAHYGFDPRDEREHLYMQGVMGLVGAADQSAKIAALKELNEVAAAIAARATWAQLRQRQVVVAIEQAYKAVGVKLIKRQLAVAVPVVGAAAGAAANAWFISNLDDAASMTYRHRVLEEKMS